MNKSLSTKKYSAIDLFSGCGGLSLGLQRAGFVVKAAVEINPIAALTYRRNHPGTFLIQDDIKNIRSQQLKELLNFGTGQIDLIAGCPPCQGFSRIKCKNRITEDDPRNNLIFDFLRIVIDLEPKMILFENVPGLIKNYRFQKMIIKLKSVGYHCNWAVLNAADFGVPQRRRRLILIGSRLGPIGIPVSNAKIKTVKDTIGRLEKLEESKDPLHRMCSKNSPRIKNLIKKIPVNGGSRKALGTKQLNCHKKIQGFNDIYGRMSWDDVAPTLTGGCFNPSKGRFLHPEQNRGITMREAALLQSFHKRYYFPAEAGLTAIARLIGDALPPLFAEKQGKHLIKHLLSLKK